MTAYQELITAALREEIVANMACARSGKRIEYATPEALIAKNQTCCLVTRSDDETHRVLQLIVRQG
jgi:hypothetical protein